MLALEENSGVLDHPYFEGYTNLSVKALANGMELKDTKLSLGSNF